MSPSARTIKFLKDRGWIVGNVEKFVRFPPPGHRVDLFGFADLIAVKRNYLVFIQTCAGASHAARMAKVKANENVRAVMAGGDCSREVWVVSWAKRGERGKRKVWTHRIEKLWHNLETSGINEQSL